MDKEIVICSAVMAEDGYVIRGHRHNDCISLAITLRKKVTHQGFVTSRNRFVGRIFGRCLQDEAGIPSVAEGGYRGNSLYSEDLY